MKLSQNRGTVANNSYRVCADLFIDGHVWGLEKIAFAKVRVPNLTIAESTILTGFVVLRFQICFGLDN